MEIAFFSDSYVPNRDGTAVVVDALARAIVRQGHRVRIYAPRSTPGPTEHVEDANGLSIARIRSHAVPLYSVYRSPYSMSLFTAISARELRREVDLLHVHTPGLMGTAGFLLARRIGRPLVGTFHTDLRAMHTAVRPKAGVPTFFRIASWYSLGVYWRCDRATAPTSSARAAMEASATKRFRSPIEVVPNGIDLGRFRPDAYVPDWRARCGLPNAPLVTYLGRLTVDKGVHRYLDAVREVSATVDLVGIIAGVGPEEAAVRERIAADPVLSARVRYVGPVTEEEKPALLAQSDLFVLASTSDTASVVLLEAMACGTAVIGPAVGGPAEVLGGGAHGRAVPVGTRGALSEAIRDLLEHDRTRRELAERGRAYVSEHASVDAMATRFLGIYREVLAKRSPTGDG
ncbi:MAG: glycosyltransferase [Thermoplasmata archaeon]